MTAPRHGVAIQAREVSKRFARGKTDVVTALDQVSFEAQHGSLTALVGPDGAGKTTLLRLATGLLRADAGTLTVLGLDVATHPQEIQNRISYMPQRFGLYEDLSVQENLDLYADLHGVTAQERAGRYPRLMEMTALAPFRDRLAGKLSGGMKQKLGLACTLVRSPDLLLLDEPTVGVDPLSRRELWSIVAGLVENEGLSVLVSTSYMDEAERCSHVIVLHEGRTVALGPPQDLSARARGHSFIATASMQESARSLQARLMDMPEIIDAVPHSGHVRTVMREAHAASVPDVRFDPVEPDLEDGLMMLLRAQASVPPAAAAAIELASARPTSDSEIVIEVHDVVRKFGDFTAVNRTSFDVRRGEVFGLLGPNGAGKTTTFRMLCGLLPATSGTLRVAGADLRRARAEARQNVGYVAQKFSLYGDLSIRENLEFFAGAYGLRNSRLKARIDWALDNFDLRERESAAAGLLPGGFQRRLAMAAALLHEPQIVFLDEPTSGADPLARREFWRRITALADHGTTIVVTTHFMEEAEYCDRIMIQDAGRMLAIGTPEAVRAHAAEDGAPAQTMEDAFIAIVANARRQAQDAS
ncbi:MAG TPA: ATP-binding cassette domain-containing protein [Povalibacter sp.]|uniref:ATP-binding cassette domain-containing protein n=1 Tax=Povalibacter sp. TaxID=1962978 RepID=UPI002C1AE5AC|nr:ATP-binding cassette domain-containing protein [Povalibacter sp.]HMN46456.1 ATP-binding cassette domain-containing protein [Povalibacter sp.]